MPEGATQPADDMNQVLWVGTGIMGAPMALRLHHAGFPVTAWNRSESKLAPLKAAGISTADSLASLPRNRRTVIIMLSTGDVVDRALFGSATETGLAERLAPGSVVIVMSSIPMDAARRQAERLATLQIDYIDAPVSGGERAAIAGTLSIMAGGSQDLLSHLSPLLAPLGKVTWVGPTGSGCLAKLANQLIVGVTIEAVAEALVLAELGGANPSAVRDALLGGFADSTILRQHGERMITRRFEPGAHATTQLKDLHTAKQLAASLGTDMPMLSLCESLYRGLCESERRTLDHSALYLACRERAGLTGA